MGGDKDGNGEGGAGEQGDEAASGPQSKAARRGGSLTVDVDDEEQEEEKSESGQRDSARGSRRDARNEVDEDQDGRGERGRSETQRGARGTVDAESLGSGEGNEAQGGDEREGSDGNVGDDDDVDVDEASAQLVTVEEEEEEEEAGEDLGGEEDAEAEEESDEQGVENDEAGDVGRQQRAGGARGLDEDIRGSVSVRTGGEDSSEQGGDSAAPDQQSKAPRVFVHRRPEGEEEYRNFKNNLPFIYDMFFNNNLDWPSQASIWGPVVAQTAQFVDQRLLYARGTDSEFNTKRFVWDGAPHLLLVADVRLPQPRTMHGWRLPQFSEETRDRNVVRRKTIIHPGEVLRIKLLCDQELAVTHTCSPLLYVWNTRTQPTRRPAKSNSANVADLRLLGHRSVGNNLNYAVDCHAREPVVASGGVDETVILWHLGDSMTALSAGASDDGEGNGGARISASSEADGRSGSLGGLNPRRCFSGHMGTVEDVALDPQRANVVASVSDDRSLRLWDERVDGSGQSAEFKDLHESDINTLAWCAADPNLLLTGSSDHLVKLIDLRKAGAAGNSRAAVSLTLPKFSGSVTSVQWQPGSSRILSAVCDEGPLQVFDRSRAGAKSSDGLAPELLFVHAGHRNPIVDFAWNPYDPWACVSVSDDSYDQRMGGGTMQMWRVAEWITRPRAEALRDLYDALATR